MEEKILFLITRKMSNEATPEELHELDHYIYTHPEAASYLDLVETIWKQQHIAVFEEDIETSYQKHINRHQPTFIENTILLKPTVYRRLWNAGSLLVAACVLAVLAGIYLYLTDFVKPGQANLAMEVLTARNARKELVLPDGTKVWLNGSSTLKYDNDMTRANTRLVYLSGEAFFDVAKDKEHPFIIKTDKISIKVLGTEFNVKAYPNEKKTETTLLRGSIELTVNNKPYQKIMLKPNEKIVLLDSLRENDGKKTDAKTRSTVDAGKTQLVIEDVQPVLVHNKEYVVETSWMEHNLVFENETLKDLAPRLEKWFDVTIEINSKVPRSMHFTGVFNKQTIEEALISLQLANPFTFKINQRHVYIN